MRAAPESPVGRVRLQAHTGNCARFSDEHEL